MELTVSVNLNERFEQTEKVRGLAQGRYSGNFVALGFELI